MAYILFFSLAILALSAAFLVLSNPCFGRSHPGGAVGVYTSRSTEGDVWVLVVISAPGCAKLESTTFAVTDADGNSLAQPVPLTQYLSQKEGILYVQKEPGLRILHASDVITIDASRFPEGSIFEFRDSSGSLGTGALS